MNRKDDAHRRALEAADRAEELRQRHAALVGGEAPTPANVDRAMQAAEQARVHDEEAHRNAANAHRRAAEAHRSAADVLDTYGAHDRAEQHRRDADVDDAGADADEEKGSGE